MLRACGFLNTWLSAARIISWGRRLVPASNMKELWLMGIYLMGFLGTGVNLGPQQLGQYHSGPMWTPFVTFGHDASDPSCYRTF